MQNPKPPDALIQITEQAARHQREGRLAESAACWRQALSLEPDNAGFHYNLAAMSFALGEWEQAAVSARRTVELRPDLAPAHLLLGAALLESKAAGQALPSLRRALELKPDFVEAMTFLGIALQATGNLAEAESSLRGALALNPRQPHTHVALGKVLGAFGKADEAAGSFNAALALNPQAVDALNELGKTLCGLGRGGEAIHFHERAVALQPGNADLHNNLGIACKEVGRLDDAAASYRKAIDLQPAHAEAHGNLGVIHAGAGDVEEAERRLSISLRLKPDPRVRVTRDLMLPPIMGTWDEVLESRRRFEENLDSLIRDEVRLDEPDKGIVYSNFYLAYHGLDDLPLQQRFAQFCLNACPSLAHASPATLRPRDQHRRQRIGFLSQHIYTHSVSLCFSKVVEALTKTGEVEIFLISNFDGSSPEVAAAYPDFTGTHARIPHHLGQARERIAALDLDVLVYMDIGMDSLSHFLAFARLARVQCVLGGHPVTTGIPNLDCFVSSAIAEPQGADAHYSERLVRLPMSTFYFERPTLPARFGKTRGDFGLPEHGNLYLCPVKLQKIHPDFDLVLANILDLDPAGHVVLFHDNKASAWSRALAQRFDRTVPGHVRQRIVFLPWVRDGADFANINALADVVLDPFHFGIGSTAITTYAVGTPTITLPGEFLRGRSVYFYCQLMDLPECIAENAPDYARKAVAMAGNRDLREQVKHKILANNSTLYDNPRVIGDLLDLFQRL